MRRISLVAVVASGLVAAIAPSAHAATNTIVPFFDPSGGGSSLNVAGCQPKGFWAIPAGLPTPPGLATGTYFYAVTALTNGGATETPTCGPLPVTVNNAASQNAALMQWNPTPGAVAYRVYRGASPATFQLLTPVPTSQCTAPASNPRCTFADSGQFAPAAGAPAFAPPNTQAGAHPDLKIVQQIGYDQDVSSNPAETNPHALKTNLIHFPPGLIANARATRNGGGNVSVCKIADPSGPSLLGDPAEFGSDDANEDTCPRESLVGTVQTVSRTRTGAGTAITTLTEGDIYNGETTGGEPGRLLIVLRPLCSAGSPVAPGSPTCTAVLGSGTAQIEKSFLTARASIVERGGTNYGIDVDTFDIKTGTDEPLSPTVDVLVPVGGVLVRAAKAPIQVQRLTQTLFGSADQGTAAAADDLPFVTLPTSCSLKTMSSEAMTWVDNTVLSGQATFTTTGCPSVPFEPGTAAGVDNDQVEAPVGFTNSTALCPDTLVSGCSTDDDPIHQSHIKSLRVTFPRGLTLSAGAGNVINSLPAGIGSVSGFSDELGDLTGVIKLQSVNTNAGGQFAGSFAIRVEVTDTKPNSDTLLVLNGTTTVDQATGQLTTTLSNLPEVPFKNLQLSFTGGPNGALVNPPDCGSHSVTQVLAPHSGGADETVADSFTTSFNGVGAACPSPRPFAPDVTVSANPPTAGTFTALTTGITRADRSQSLAGFTLALPPGMLARLGDFAFCPSASADAGTCSDSTQVGKVTISAGTGSSPATLTGKIFLAEPLPGSGDVASLVVVIPAKVGPFDLGTVVSRAGLDIHFSEGQVIVTTTGKLPAILGGIPVRIQSLNLTIDRANFQHNPSSCVAKTLDASFTSQGDPTTATTAAEGGATSTDKAPFQATNCDALPFAPKIVGTVGGPDMATEGQHPDLDVTITQADGEASTKSAVATLPPVFGVGIDALGNSCPENQLLTGTCPEGSLVGTASATSGLLAQPLGGPVFLVDQPGGLPKLSVLLFGSAVSLRLDGQVQSSGGRIVNTFEGIPDVPLSSFTLHIDGGDGGLLQNTADLCEGTGALDGTFTAYNDKVATATAPLELLDGSCPRKAKKPKTSLVLSGLGSGKPEMTLKVRRGSDASASLLGRLRLILPKGLNISSYPGNLLGVRAAKKLSRGKLTIGRRKLVVEQFPGNGAQRVKLRLRKGTLRASDRLARRGRAARLVFKLRAKTKGGKTFSFKVKVRPRS